MTGQALLGTCVAVTVSGHDVLEERMLRTRLVGPDFVGHSDDAGGGALLGLVVVGLDLGAQLGGLEVLDLNVAQLGDASVEFVGSGLEFAEGLVFGVGQVAPFLSGTLEDALDGFAEFGPFLHQLLEEVHGFTFVFRWVVSFGCRRGACYGGVDGGAMR